MRHANCKTASTTSITIDELLLIAHEANATEPGHSQEARNDRARAFFASLTGHLPYDDAILLSKAMNYPWLMERKA